MTDRLQNIVASAALITGAVLGILCVRFYFLNELFLIGADKFFYMASAAHFIQTGVLADAAVFPVQAVATPQIGVVGIYALLFLAGLSEVQSLFAVSTLNICLHIAAAPFIYCLMKISGVPSKVYRLWAVGIYLGAWQIWRMQLNPINDGIFNALCVPLFLLCIIVLRSPEKKKYFIAASLFAALLCIFRVQAMVVLALFALTYLIFIPAKKGRVIFILAAVCAAFFLGSNLFTGGELIPIIQKTLLTRWNALCRDGLSRLLWNDLPWMLVGRSNFFPFTLSIFFLLFWTGTAVYSFVKKRADLFFCTILILVSIFAFGTWQIRYAMFVFPLILLIGGAYKWSVKLSIIPFVLIICFTAVTLKSDWHRSAESKLWQYLYHQPLELRGEPVRVISSKPHHPYFFLNAQSVKPKEGALLTSYIVGNEAYRESCLRYFDGGQNNYLRNLTPSFDGWAVSEVIQETDQ